MFDLLIRGARVVNATRSDYKDIGIEHGKVATLLRPGEAASAKAVVDASGLVAIPGLVDAHVHLREPGLVHKEGFESGTRAAAAGGVTTVMVMPTDKPATFTPAEFEDKRALAEGQVFVDFALQAALGRNSAHIESLIELGCISFEIFLADVADEMLVPDAESLLVALSRIAEAGTIAGITPGDHDVVVSRTAKARAAGAEARNFPPSRPPISEALGVARACIAAAETGARVHIRQMSCAAGLQAFKAMKPLGRLTAEVTPHNLTLDESELDRQGVFAKVAPPLRPRTDVDAMIDGLKAGTVDIVATDHAPHLQAEKIAGSTDIWKAPGGFPGLQTFLPVMLSLVAEGSLTLESLVSTCATRPADIFGLPFKGRIAPGADADIVLLDLSTDFEIRSDQQLSKAAHTPFDGRTSKGRPVRVFLRGREVMTEGRVAAPPTGQFVVPVRAGS